ncbi:phosphoenolpyruvate carboxylase [Mycobacterium avium]|uniref:phosphoenolpyruvate carboxylase n=1 Tax=Mycobacterium avium TaxID=1764 RepID=UPI00079FDBB9
MGGDRDGTPSVPAEVVRRAPGAAASPARAHSLAELTACEQELSMSARLVAVPPELAALAEDCAEKARADEPYRRALRVIRGRPTATPAEILDRRPPHQADPGLAAYATAAGLRGGLVTADAPVAGAGCRVVAAGEPGPGACGRRRPGTSGGVA